MPKKMCIDSLSETYILGPKSSKLPLDQNLELSTEGGKALKDHIIHKRLIGKLMYLTLTRAYLSSSIVILSQFMEISSNQHLNIAHKVLRYMKGIIGQGIFIHHTQLS